MRNNGMPAHNTGSILTDADYNSIENDNAGDILCYTCNSNWEDITIVFFTAM